MTLTQEYIDGITEGRAWLRQHSPADAPAHLANLEATCRMFAAQSPVGQHLRGQRDFWRAQVKRLKTSVR